MTLVAGRVRLAELFSLACWEPAEEAEAAAIIDTLEAEVAELRRILYAAIDPETGARSAQDVRDLIQGELNTTATTREVIEREASDVGTVSSPAEDVLDSRSLTSFGADDWRGDPAATSEEVNESEAVGSPMPAVPEAVTSVARSDLPSSLVGKHEPVGSDPVSLEDRREASSGGAPASSEPEGLWRSQTGFVTAAPAATRKDVAASGSLTSPLAAPDDWATVEAALRKFSEFNLSAADDASEAAARLRAADQAKTEVVEAAREAVILERMPSATSAENAEIAARAKRLRNALAAAAAAPKRNTPQCDNGQGPCIKPAPNYCMGQVCERIHRRHAAPKETP